MILGNKKVHLYKTNMLYVKINNVVKNEPKEK
jgi:hypothetical protein